MTMGVRFRWIGLALLAATVAGCGPRLSEEDLGTVVEISQVPGIQEPYELPQGGGAADDSLPGESVESADADPT